MHAISKGVAAIFYIRVSIGNLAESTAPLSGFNYLGDLPFAFEDWYIDNNITWRRFFLKVDDLPDLQSLSSQIRFSLEPSTNQADLDYFIYVDLGPQEETNCGLFSGSGVSVFEVVRRLVEVPISGKVSDLIAAGRLENVPSGSWTEHKTIKGVLEVDVDYSFDGPGGAFRPTLYLLPGTQILVRAGSTFTMLNSDLFTCDTLATGLTLEAGATLVATTSTIKDCRFAVDAKPGSTIKLVSNDFSDNYIGLNLDMNGVPEADKRVNILAMTGNSFSTDAAGDFFPDPFVHEMQWKGAYRLYRKILRHPALENFSQQFEDFKADNDSLSTGRLAYIAEERSKIFAFSTAQDSLMELYRLAWHDGMADLLALDSMRQAGDTSTLVSQYDSAVLQSTSVRTQYALYLDTLKMSVRAKIQAVLTANAAISTALAPADNHKAVNAIVFGLLLNDTLATGDLAALEAIADMCPLEGGDAVYEARAIVAHLTGAGYDDAVLCDLPEEMRQPQKPEAVAGDPGSIMLFPNPCTGQVYWRGTGDQMVRVRVFSAVGQLLGEVVSATGFANLDKLPDGLHLVQLLSLDNNLLATRKIHLIKR